MFLNKSNFFFDSGLFFGGTNVLEKNINCYNLHFFLGRRKSIFIVNFSKYIYIFRVSLFYIYRLISLRGKILGFDDRMFIRRCLIFFFNRANQFYIAKNWIGGTLTNFKNFKRFFSQISKGLRSLKQYYHIFVHFYGLKMTQRLPSLMIFTNPNPSSLGSLQESFRIGIPIFSIIDVTTVQNFGITFPLPCNGEDFEAVFLFYNIIGDTLLYGWIKPVMNFFSNFLKRLKKIRKTNFLVNREEIINYYAFYFQDIFKKNFFFSYIAKKYNFYFLKKFKFFSLNFYFLKKRFFKKSFKKKFFKKSFFFRWFIKKVLKRRRLKKKRKKKLIKRIFKYKFKKKKKKTRGKKFKDYKIFRFFNIRVKFIIKKFLRKYALKNRARSNNFINYLKYFLYRKHYKKIKLENVIKKYDYEQQHIEKILEEYDELPEERKEKALRNLKEEFRKMSPNLLLIEKINNTKLIHHKQIFVENFNKYLFNNINKINNEINTLDKLKLFQTIKQKNEKKFYPKIYNYKKTKLNFSLSFLKLRLKYKFFLKKRSLKKIIKDDKIINIKKLKFKKPNFFVLKRFIYFF